MILRLALLAAMLLAAWPAAADDRPGFSVPMQQKDSGAYYVRGAFGAIETNMLVDTGSSYVALSRKTFTRLSRELATNYRRSIRGATAGGRVIDVKVYEIEELALGENCVLHNVEVVVLPGADRDILGLSALRRLQPFALEFEPPALRFAACRDNLVPAAETTAETQPVVTPDAVSARDLLPGAVAEKPLPENSDSRQSGPDLLPLAVSQNRLP